MSNAFRLSSDLPTRRLIVAELLEQLTDLNCYTDTEDSTLKYVLFDQNDVVVLEIEGVPRDTPEVALIRSGCVSRAELKQLREEASAAGDLRVARYCDGAMNKNAMAYAACCYWIASAY